MDIQGQQTPPSADEPATPELEITQGEDLGQTFQLKEKTRIGRERDNDIVLLDPKVSRYHAMLTLEADQWNLTDLGSSNHTYLNGQVVTVATLLAPGDLIGIGETELTFRISGLAAADTLPLQMKKEPETVPVPQPLSAPAAAPSPSQNESSRSAPPRLAWVAGGFVLFLCLAAVIVIYMISRSTTGPESAGIASPPPPVEGGTLVAPVEPVEVAPVPENLVLLYEDDFSDSFGGWDDAFDEYTTKQYGNNRYQIEVGTDNLIAWGLANRDAADFELEVEARQEDGGKGNSYGLLFRIVDRDNFYRYDISSDGFFLLSRFMDGQWLKLIDWTQSPFINPDDNVLKVSAFGPNITVWANGEPLGTVTDDSFQNGNFGFFASTFGEPYTWVSFDNLKMMGPKDQQITMLPSATPRRAAPEPTLSNTPTKVSDTVSVIATPAETAITVDETTTPESTTATPRPSRTPTPTPVPLPEYASRDQPLARGEQQVTGRFVFPVFDPARGTYDIYIANAADGSDRELVQQDASQPALTQDGAEIAYRSWQADKRGMFARPLAGGDAWQFELFFESARPNYSPVDNSLMYHSRTGGEEPAVYRVINGVGQVMRRDGAPIQGRNAKWSPDGQQFVYSSCLNNNCGVILSNLDGTSPVVLTDHPTDTNPEISPDGSTIVFMSQRSGDWDVYSVSINGGEIKALTDDDSSDGLPTWSPNGNKIAFVSNRDGEWSIWDMDPDGSNERRLFELEGSIDGRIQVDVANSFGWVEESIDWIP